MTPQGKDLFSNAGGGFNPMMLWMLDKNRQESGQGMDMMTMFMMSSMMGGQNPLKNMFQPVQQQPVQQQPVQQPVQQTDVLKDILNNSDAIAKLKEILKSE